MPQAESPPPSNRHARRVRRKLKHVETVAGQRPVARVSFHFPRDGVRCFNTGILHTRKRTKEKIVATVASLNVNLTATTGALKKGLDNGVSLLQRFKSSSLGMLGTIGVGMGGAFAMNEAVAAAKE